MKIVVATKTLMGANKLKLVEYLLLSKSYRPMSLKAFAIQLGISEPTIHAWEKVHDYDEETLFKRYVMSIIHPYQMSFHVGNLESIDWE